ncbi:MAG: hypothetical protein HYY24_29745 [Verrucomicrobia bacterium]|nr:hypothetical protein [Verrucomicrobiota bacterium]
MKMKNTIKARGNHATGVNAMAVRNPNRRPSVYPAGSLGADPMKRDYVRHLVERFNRLKQAEAGLGKGTGSFSFSLIFQDIESAFREQTYFIPAEQFDALVDYLQRRINQTKLGKRNLARGYRNYDSFDEHCFAASERAQAACAGA